MKIHPLDMAPFVQQGFCFLFLQEKQLRQPQHWGVSLRTGSMAQLTKHDPWSQRDPVWTLTQSDISWNILGKLFIIYGPKDPHH